MLIYTIFKRLNTTLCLFVLLNLNANAIENSGSLVTIGYDGEAWYPYVLTIPADGRITKKHWRKIEQLKNPVLVTRQAKTGNFYSKLNNGLIYEFDYETKDVSVLPIDLEAKENLDTYSQLKATESGLAMVQLIDGKSSNTKLLFWDKKLNNQVELTKQNSAKFHPIIVENSLFYAHVVCRISCAHLIQEVWERNLATGYAKQLTLLNAVTSLHSVFGDYGYISSNHFGSYDIARLNRTSGEIEWITKSDFADSFPSADGNGNLYFIRRDNEGNQLMRINSNELQAEKIKQQGLALEKITLPREIKKIRFLEITQ